jgi:hypothetical protein
MTNVLTAPLFRQISEEETEWARVIDARQAAIYSKDSQAARQAEEFLAAKIYEKLEDSAREV